MPSSLVPLAMLLASAAWVGTAHAAIDLRADAEVALGDTTAVRLGVTNTGDEDALDVAPLVVFRGEEVEAPRVQRLPPGARHAWHLDFRLPDAPGSFPVTTWLRFRAGDGAAFSLPAVHLVETPGLLGDRVGIAVELTPISRFGRAHVLLTNPEDVALHGRLVTLLPEELSVEPQSRPVEIEARGRTELPVVIQNHGAHPGRSQPVQMLFEYEHAGVHHSVLATTRAEIVAPGDGAPVPPVLVGGLALAGAIGLLALAWWRAAARQRLAAAAERREAERS